MKAIILSAGGNGKLYSRLNKYPKSMLDISDTNLLSMQIDTLYKCGIEDIVVVRGFGKEYITIPGIKYYDNNNYSNTGVLYSLFCAEKELDNDLLIIYGDIAFNQALIRKIIASKSDFSAGVIVNYKELLSDTESYAEKEMLTFDSENHITKIGKNLSESDTTGFFSGILKCSKSGSEILKRHYHRIEEIEYSEQFLDKENLKTVWLTDFLDELTKLGVSMACTIIEKGWYELNSETDYIRLCNDTEFMSEFLSIKTDWNERSKTYNNIQWVNMSSTLDTMVEMTDGMSPQKILDLGTGTGKVLMAMKNRYPNAECYGIDVSSGMMNKINEDKFNLSVGSIEDLSRYDNEFFDIVTARMVLHHSSDLEQVFKEVKRVLKSGGRFIVCEGNPPTKECLDFYQKMFNYKETRHTFLIDDLMNLYINTDFKNIVGKVVTMKNMSLNNWLENAGVPFRNIDIIRRMHYEADQKVKSAYNMQEKDQDLWMTWKFSIISAEK